MIDAMRGKHDNISSVAGAMLGGIIFLACWEAAARSLHNYGLVPPLWYAFKAAEQWFQSGLLSSDLLESLPRAWLSLLLAAPVGVIIGLVFALNATTRWVFDGVVQFFRSLPPVALLPLFIIWFGIDWSSKLNAAWFVCVFPIAVTTTQGATVAHLQYVELARDFKLSRLSYIFDILLPAAGPAIVPGLRLSAGTAFVMLYVSELSGASVGLGYRISIAQLAYQADLMIAALFVLGLTALLTDVLIQYVANKVMHYAGRT